MKILVISDSHGATRNLRTLLSLQRDADVLIHLGDGERDLEQFKSLTERMQIYQVCGNCDLGSLLPETRLEILGGKRLLLTHGHKFHVKYGDGLLLEQGRALHADILLYGHTHQAVTEYRDGIWVMNPGALLNGCYGLVDIVPQGIVCNCVQF